MKLLPTPRAQNGEGRNNKIWERPADQPQNIENALAHVAPDGTDWGDYAAAIARWEPIIGRPASDPADTKGCLSPVFVEWMMGLPSNWVTGVDLARTHQLKILGNGVVPQQAALALNHLLPRL